MGLDPRRARTDADEDINPLRRAAERGRSKLAIAFGGEEGKESKTDADYRPATSTKRCGKCVWGTFAPGANVGTCSIVAGGIRDADVCNHFELDRRNARQHGKETAALLDAEDNDNESLEVRSEKRKKGQKPKFAKTKLTKKPSDEKLTEVRGHQDGPGDLANSNHFQP